MATKNYESFSNNEPLLATETEKTTQCRNVCKFENIFDKINPKFTTSAACVTWGFLTGVERAIILPTLWLYFVSRFGNAAATTYYGITLSAFNLGTFLSAPMYGYLAYKGFKTKALLVVGNQMEIVGNVIYFAATEPWLVMIGRFIAGIGSGCEVPLYADIVRTTTAEERTPYLVILLLARQVGLIIGPAATLILHPMKFQMGNITLNIYNSPGFLMAILWCVQTIQVLVSYPDVSKTRRPVVDKDINIGIQERMMSKIYERNHESESQPGEETSVGTVDDANNTKTIGLVDHLLSKYFNYITMTMLVIIFCAYFSLISLEVVLPPVTVTYFSWNEVENSYLYLIAGVLVIIIYAVLQKVSQYVKDRTVIIIGLILVNISYSWMTMSLAFINVEQAPLYIGLLCVGIAFHIFGLSIVIACCESLFTKTLPVEEMDMAQTILRMTINFSFLIGPFFAGSLQMYAYIVFLTLFLFMLYSLVSMMIRYSSFDI